MPTQPKTSVLIEACVDSVESAIAAERGGAGRIELCDNLVEGGTTPSAGTIAECRKRLRIPIYVMIRPRGGDFLYSAAEVAVMRRDIVQAEALGADGVVLGLLQRDGTVDVARTRALIALARPLDVTFHRAIDVCRDPEEALVALIALGVDRVLTSGQAPTAWKGAAVIARLVRRAAGRIAILPGGGIDERNARRLVERTGAREVHVRGTAPVKSRMKHRSRRVRFRSRGRTDDFVLDVTDERRIRRLARVLSGVKNQGS
ncbi:MAG: copper homeostasis protein CutC [Gemmatimonadetes bacterium]|nr:copper homeostasis protein CutC [Gemmatimonadota bacterium]